MDTSKSSRTTRSFTIDISKVPGKTPGTGLTREITTMFRDAGLPVATRKLGGESVYYMGLGYAIYYPKSGKLYIASRPAMGSTGYNYDYVGFESAHLGKYILQTERSRQTAGYIPDSRKWSYCGWNHPTAPALVQLHFSNVS